MERQEEKKRKEEITEKDGHPKVSSANKKDSKKVEMHCPISAY